MKTIRRFCFSLVMLLAIAPLLNAQNPDRAPVPSEFQTAKKIFVAYGGGPSDRSGYTGTDTRTYDQFFTALKTWGHYDLVSSPSDADLVFEISFACPLVPFTTSSLYSGPVRSKSAYDPHFRLSVIDMKTHVTIWTVIEHIDLAVLQKNSDKNFDNAMTALVNDIAKFAGAAPAIVINRGQK